MLEIGFSHPLIRLVKSSSRHPYHILPHRYHQGSLCIDHTSILMEDIVYYCKETQLKYIFCSLKIKRNKNLHLYMYVNNYSATTRTGACDYPIMTFFFFFLKKKKILKFFCKRINKMQGSTMQSLKTLKPCELTWPLKKQLSNSGISYWSICKKLENPSFSKKVVIG